MDAFFKKREGCVIWITGLPGAGKTVLADELYRLIKDVTPAVRVDGDVIREMMGNDLGYDPESRKLNAWRLAKLNKYLAEHYLTVICSTVSLIKEIHKWNRKNIKNFIEVYIEVSIKDLIARDKKGIYSKALNGEIKDAYAINQSYDIPEKPDFVIKNNKDLNFFLKNAQDIKNLILKK
ncbi:MAG: adenylyl-sulfate kinase [Candidatus Pacebacteria bacterium]|nr:adenylyl-sulfate kinase [Candidatus Paceibacterota bacterium]